MNTRPARDEDLIKRLERFRTAISITQSEWAEARRAVAEAIAILRQLRQPFTEANP